jgi:hypothetical protein
MKSSKIKRNLIEKLFVLVNGKTSQGVQNLFKEGSDCLKVLSSLRKALRKSTLINS